MKKYNCLMQSFCEMGVLIQKCQLCDGSLEQLKAFVGDFCQLLTSGPHPAVRVMFSVSLPVEEKPKSEIDLALEEIMGDRKQTSYVRNTADCLKSEIEKAYKGKPCSSSRIRQLRDELLCKTQHLSAVQLQALYNFIVH